MNNPSRTCRLLLIALALGGLALAPLAGGARAPSGTARAAAQRSPATKPGTRVSPARRSRPSAEPSVPTTAAAESRTAARPPAATPQPETPDNCNAHTAQRQSLSGWTAEGLFFANKGAPGVKATIGVEGDRFTVTYGDFKATVNGTISAFNQRQATYFALKFDQNADLQAVREAGTPIACLQLREVGSKDRMKINDLNSHKPFILETVRAPNGAAAGPDVAFLFCPKHPDCLDWPSCPCKP